MIVKNYHEKGHHISGTNKTLLDLTSRFCIIAGREEIRAWKKECAECRKCKAKPAGTNDGASAKDQSEGTSRSVLSSSCRFCWPILHGSGRGKRRKKRYLCLFTCLLSRTVHLEVAFGKDTGSTHFRMINCRGLPQEVISDNGGNVVGGDKELRELVKKLDKNKIQNSAADQHIKWHFNPPLAPHFGEYMK